MGRWAFAAVAAALRALAWHFWGDGGEEGVGEGAMLRTRELRRVGAAVVVGKGVGVGLVFIVVLGKVVLGGGWCEHSFGVLFDGRCGWGRS